MGNFTFFANKSIEKPRGGGLFLVSVLLLWGLGIFTLFICSTNTALRIFGNKYYFVIRQLVWSGVGLLAMAFISLMPLKLIRKSLPLLVFVSLILCLLTHIPGIGVSLNGAPRWIKIPFIGTIQPSEIVKFVMVLFLANLFEKYSRDEELYHEEFLYPLIGLIVFVGVVFLQKDFSTGVFIFVVGSLMFFVTGANMKWFLPLFVLGIIAAVIMICLEEYRLNRVMAFFKPEDYALSIGYQQMRSRMAITSGGLLGNGMGSGMKYVNSIPEIQADYIFAGWTNIMGLLGVCAYFIVLIFFACQGYKIAFTGLSRFASYSAFGCTTLVFLQSLVNVAVVCGALPATGIPLPFFSSGGSAQFMTFVMCGLILNASHAEAEDDEFEIYSEDSDISKIESFNGVVVENE